MQFAASVCAHVTVRERIIDIVVWVTHSVGFTSITRKVSDFMDQYIELLLIIHGQVKIIYSRWLKGKDKNFIRFFLN